MPETTIAASGAGAPAEDVYRSAGRASRRRWRRGGAAVLITAMVVAGAAVYGAYGYAPPESGRSYHSAYLGSVRGYYADTTVARSFYLHEGTGSPVVLISPGDSPAYAWHNQLSVLAAAGHSVYVVDLPGQGRTVLHDSSFGWDLSAMTGALASFLDAIHLQRTALVGNSWSGGWALSFAQRYPHRVSRLLYMAVPMLASDLPFYVLDPGILTEPPAVAASTDGAAPAARKAGLQDMQPADLMACGSVAVNRDGARLGKGAGYSDIEVALLQEAGLIGPATIIVTTVHPLQVLTGPIPQTEHDFSIDLIVTAGQVIERGPPRRPRGLYREHLTPEKIAAIPILAARAGPKHH